MFSSDVPPYIPNIRHRRQVFWQIIFPLLIACLITISIAILAILSVNIAKDTVTRWSMISTIWVILPLLLSGVVLLGILGGMIYGLIRLFGVLPQALQWLQWRFYEIWAISRIISDRVTSPFIQIHSSIAGFKTFWKRIFRRS